MAGISKHYVFSVGGRQFLDYQIPLMMLNCFPQYAGPVGGSALAGQSRLQKQLQAIIDTNSSWRKRIRLMWNMAPARIREKTALQEFRVRPARGSKQCPFRQVAGILRKFHKSKKVKFNSARLDLEAIPQVREVPRLVLQEQPPAGLAVNMGQWINMQQMAIANQFANLPEAPPEPEAPVRGIWGGPGR